MFIGSKQRLLLIAACAAIIALPVSANAQHSKKSGMQMKILHPKSTFRPTCNLDSNSVGFYFYPPNLGAKWMLRTVAQMLDASSHVLKTDTTYSFEKIVSDSGATLQGLPVLGCIASMPYHAGGEDSAKLSSTEYYVDDSVIMTVFNHSVTSELNHILLVNPLAVGASWKDRAGDTIRSYVVSDSEPVSVPYGSFPKALVVKTPAGFGLMTKYFVGGVGLVKIIFHGIPPQENGSFIVTSELVSLEKGNPKRNIRYRFWALEHPKKKVLKHKRK